EAEGVDAAAREQALAARDHRPDDGQVEAGGEDRSVRVEDAAAELRLALEASVGLGEAAQELRPECVALVRPVDAHEEHVIAHLGRDPSFAHQCQLMLKSLTGTSAAPRTSKVVKSSAVALPRKQSR